MKPIITSLLDTDLYKPTVQQIIQQRFANIEAEYEFTCRNYDTVDLLRYVPEDQLREQIFEHLPNLRLTDDEYEYLKGVGYFKPGYLEFLRNFRFNPKEQITLTKHENGRTYKIKARGPWSNVMYYETLVLSIVNEIFSANYRNDLAIETIGNGNLNIKIGEIQKYNQECIDAGFSEPKIIEFGSRRRRSAEWQKYVLETLVNKIPDNMVGTSNVHLARTMGLTPIGTFGHEFVMGMQGMYPVQHSQRMAFRTWLEEYRGQWGIALTDTLGDKKFFKDFSFDLAKGFDGVRHDSGSPIAYGEYILDMYDGFNINPMTKRIVFSDGLNAQEMIRIHKNFRGRINTSYGIGTNLTNDVGIPVLHNVMKITKCNGQPTVKLSANPAKASCTSKTVLEYTKLAINDFNE